MLLFSSERSVLIFLVPHFHFAFGHTPSPRGNAVAARAPQRRPFSRFVACEGFEQLTVMREPLVVPDRKSFAWATEPERAP
jgi:hypothetical protein